MSEKKEKVPSGCSSQSKPSPSSKPIQADCEGRQLGVVGWGTPRDCNNRDNGWLRGCWKSYLQTYSAQEYLCVHILGCISVSIYIYIEREMLIYKEYICIYTYAYKENVQTYNHISKEWIYMHTKQNKISLYSLLIYIYRDMYKTVNTAYNIHTYKWWDWTICK